MDVITKTNQDGLLFDGAMGSMLIQKGLPSDQTAEFWNLEKPELIGDIHQAYLDSGCDVITTNTFGGSPLKLKKAGLDQHVAEINCQAVKIARSVAGTLAYVAGDIGPSGEMLKPFGTVSAAEMTDHFAAQADALSQNGVDFFIIETMFDINESLAAIRGVQCVSDLPIFATLTFDEKPTGFATVMGNRVETGLKKLQDNGARVVGANCTLGSDRMLALAREISATIKGLTMVQPNAGIPEKHGKRLEYPEDARYFARNMGKIKEVGIDVIGGCCGTTPVYLRQIAESLRS